MNESASRLGLPVAGVSALMCELLSMITNERTGGAQGFFDLFRRAGFGDALTSWFGEKEGQPITAPQIESVLGATTVDRLASVSGLTRASATSALALLVPKVIARLAPSGVLPSSSALLSQVSSDLRQSVPVAPPMVERAAWPRWLPWAALALVALVGWLWLRGPAGTIDPQLTLNNRDGKVTYSGLVRDEATRTAIVSALNATFGPANVSGDIRIDRNVRQAAWLPRLGDLFASLNRPGVDLSLTGNAISLGGWLSAADRQALTDKLRGILGSQATIGALGDAVADAVRSANEQALSALDALGTSGVSADSVVQAMNLAVINFASGSAEVPADSMHIIRRSAAAIKGASAGTKIEVGGHTDNTGDPASNLTLSQQRADAVKSALVSAGAPAATLTTKGYGDNKPRATNDTEYGRFQNRRIEYTVVR